MSSHDPELLFSIDPYIVDVVVGPKEDQSYLEAQTLAEVSASVSKLVNQDLNAQRLAEGLVGRNNHALDLAKAVDTKLRSDLRGEAQEHIERTIRISSEVGLSRGVGKELKGRLYTQALGLYKELKRLAINAAGDIGDYHGAAVAIASMYGNSSDVAEAFRAIDCFRAFRIKHCETMFNVHLTSDLHKSLIGLCDVDPSQMSVRRLVGAFFEESFYYEQSARITSPLARSKELPAIMAGYDPNVTSGDESFLISELLRDVALNHERPHLVARILSEAEARGIDVAPTVVLFERYRQEQLPESPYHQAYGHLALAASQSGRPLLSLVAPLVETEAMSGEATA